MPRRPVTSIAVLASLLACVLVPAPALAADGRLTLSPAQFQPLNVAPGSTYELELTARNDTDASLDLSAYAVVLEGSSEPGTFAVPAKRGAEAVRWVSFPTFETARTIAPGRSLSFTAQIDVPNDAPPGTTTLGLAVTQVVSARGTVDDEQPGSRVRLSAGLASTVVLRVPGEAAASIDITSTDAPRVLWGGSRGRFRATVVNDGNVDVTAAARLQLASRLGGGDAAVDAPTASWLLPRGAGNLAITWADRPWLGWFTPTIVVSDADRPEVQVEQTLPSVLVLPPWWVLGLLAGAIALPIWRIRRRQRAGRGPISR